MYKIKKNGDTKFKVFLNGDDPCIRLGDHSDDPTFTFPNESGEFGFAMTAGKGINIKDNEISFESASSWTKGSVIEDAATIVLVVPSTAKEIYLTGQLVITDEEMGFDTTIDFTANVIAVSPNADMIQVAMYDDINMQISFGNFIAYDDVGYMFETIPGTLSQNSTLEVYYR